MNLLILLLGGFSILMISFSNSMLIILSILMLSLLGAFLSFQSISNQWLSFMILFIMVGGLMILYVFILSMNSNESLQFKGNFNFTFLFILIVLFFNMGNQKTSEKAVSKLIYENFTFFILSMLLLIVLMMYFSSKMIMSPSNPSKSMK